MRHAGHRLAKMFWWNPFFVGTINPALIFHLRSCGYLNSAAYGLIIIPSSCLESELHKPGQKCSEAGAFGEVCMLSGPHNKNSPHETTTELNFDPLSKLPCLKVRQSVLKRENEVPIGRHWLVKVFLQSFVLVSCEFTGANSLICRRRENYAPDVEVRVGPRTVQNTYTVGG